MSGSETNLPKWAQNELGNLRRKVAYLEGELSFRTYSDLPQYAFLDWYDNEPAPVRSFLRERPQVYFGDQERGAYYAVKFNPKTYELEVHASGSSRGLPRLDTPLNVSPVSSNIVTVNLRSHA